VHEELAKNKKISKDSTTSLSQMTRRLPLPDSREFLAIHLALVNDSHNFSTFSSQLVYWQTDNQACVRFLQTGSRQPHIQFLDLDVKKKERDLNIAVIPVWMLRDHSSIAAAGSCFATSTDEWFLDSSNVKPTFFRDRLLSFSY
jgi:hypothetical protein